MPPPPTPTILIFGTLDTKLPEYLYLRSQIQHYYPEANIILLDTGRSSTTHEAITIPQSEVLAASRLRNGNGNSNDVNEGQDLMSLPRGEVIKAMIAGAIPIVQKLHEESTIHAAIALGGSGGTSIAAAVMCAALPLALPKLIVSTVASGDTSSYVGETDITMMYSVVDIAGLNEVLKGVLDNAAGAIAGMARAYVGRIENGRMGAEEKKRGVGVTMFGVTTPAVDAARAWLEANGFEVYVFHATGAGGRAMERLVREGRLDGVLDLTTTELADELVGGVFSAGENRLTAAAKAGIPQIVSVGALDMVNFGPKDTVPEKFEDRRLFEHNPSVTLMRTTKEECEELGRRIVQRLIDNCRRADVTEVWLPLKGISAIAVEGQAFYDREADEALCSTIKDGLKGSEIKVIERDTHINDTRLSEDMARRLKELVLMAG